MSRYALIEKQSPLISFPHPHSIFAQSPLISTWHVQLVCVGADPTGAPRAMLVVPHARSVPEDAARGVSIADVVFPLQQVLL
jgi:hypothetical protein